MDTTLDALDNITRLAARAETLEADCDKLKRANAMLAADLGAEGRQRDAAEAEATKWREMHDDRDHDLKHEFARAEAAEAQVAGMCDLYNRQSDMLDTAKDERDAALAEVARLREALAEALHWFENAPVSYANGNTHNGLDEGEVIGGQIHDELTEQIRCALHGFPLDNSGQDAATSP